MSIEPEVPYDFPVENSEDDLDNSWRDPSMSSISDRPSQRESRRPADDSWMLPVREFTDILGHGVSRIREIEKHTGSRIEFNHHKQQIDIWGDTKAIASAKAYLDSINTRLQEENARNAKKVLGWEKPERELTGKELARFERKQERLKQEQTYQKVPLLPQPWNASFPLPEQDSVPLKRLIGENERYLNKIRVDCKAYIFYNQNTRIFRISGETEDCVHKAASRLRNWYLKCTRTLKSESVLIMKQPKENYKIKFRKAPNRLILCNRISNKLPASRNIYLCYPVKPPLDPSSAPAVVDLFSLSGSHEGIPRLIPESLQKMDRENQVYIEKILEDGLESVRLLDGEIRMKIRFGQLAISNVVLKEDATYPIEKVSKNLFLKDELVSTLQPCLAAEKCDLDKLFEYLDKNGENYSAEPETSFSIYARQRSHVISSPKNNSKGAPKIDEMLPTIITTKFTADGHASLWNCFMDESHDFCSVKSVDLEGNYAWDLRLQYARRLLSESDSPHGQFVSKLRLRETNRLAMVIDDKNYRPMVIVQKTRWFYGWKSGYLVEICKDEIWNMDEITIKHKDLPVDLSTFDPHRIMYKVSLIKDSWRDRFSQNINLSIGEAPNWTIGSFLASSGENVQILMELTKEFGDILTSTVETFWDQ